MEPTFGSKAVNEAFENLAHKSRISRMDNKKMMAQGTGILGEVGRTSVKDKDNFGSLSDELKKGAAMNR